jgi:Flp pilus assembly protein TadB
MAPRYRFALLGIVPIVVLLVSLNLASWLTDLLGLPQGLGVLVVFVLMVLGFFVSRAILRRGFAHREPS